MERFLALTLIILISLNIVAWSITQVHHHWWQIGPVAWTMVAGQTACQLILCSAGIFLMLSKERGATFQHTLDTALDLVWRLSIAGRAPSFLAGLILLFLSVAGLAAFALVITIAPKALAIKANFSKHT